MGLMDEFKKWTSRSSYGDDMDDYDEYDDEPYEEAPAEEPAARRGYGRSAAAPAAEPARTQPAGRVVNINPTTQLQVVLVKPERFDLVTEIADHLRGRKAVVLNLESTNKDVARRLVDFLSGCAYAIDGNIKKIAISTYLVTPCNVDVTGDQLEEIGSAGVYF